MSRDRKTKYVEYVIKYVMKIYFKNTPNPAFSPDNPERFELFHLNSTRRDQAEKEGKEIFKSWRRGLERWDNSADGISRIVLECTTTATTETEIILEGKGP